MINHSSQYGIRGQVWIDHLPIKYYVPQGSQQGRIDNGPYQGNLGDYTHPARADNDTLETTGRAYFGDHLTVTQGHPLYRHIRCLNQIRRAIPALQKAPMSHVGEWGSGMRFMRDHNNGESYCVVGLAVGSDQNISVGNVRNGTYRDAVTGNGLRIGGGIISFYVRANSAGIYVLDGSGRVGEEGPYLRYGFEKNNESRESSQIGSR